MNLDQLFPALVFAVFAVVAGSFVLKIWKHGGFKGAMFGAPIERTLGEIDLAGTTLRSMKLKVYLLGGGSAERAIGLELVARTFASYRMVPVTLSSGEAQKLMMLLQTAATFGNRVG